MWGLAQEPSCSMHRMPASTSKSCAKSSPMMPTPGRRLPYRSQCAVARVLRANSAMQSLRFSCDFCFAPTMLNVSTCVLRFPAASSSCAAIGTMLKICSCEINSVVDRAMFGVVCDVLMRWSFRASALRRETRRQFLCSQTDTGGHTIAPKIVNLQIPLFPNRCVVVCFACMVHSLTCGLLPAPTPQRANLAGQRATHARSCTPWWPACAHVEKTYPHTNLHGDQTRRGQ